MPELSESEFEVLSAAVRQARDLQIKSLKSLRERLVTMFPGRLQDIEQAIGYWRAEVRRQGLGE